MITSDHAKVITEFFLEESVSSQLKSYYILHWDLELAVRKIPLGSKTITHYGQTYIVILDPDYNFWETFSKGNRNKKVLLSFRKPLGSTHGYVMVRPDFKTHPNKESE